MRRNASKRVLDTLKAVNRRGYNPYDKGSDLAWMYSLKWSDDVRREYDAHAALVANASHSRKGASAK